MARLRTKARSYLRLVGPQISLNDDSGDIRWEHTEAIMDAQTPHVYHAFNQTLNRALPAYVPLWPITARQPTLQRDNHEEVYNAALELAIAENDAAYLFGVAVGIEHERLRQRATSKKR
jgi:hypothetical protein